MIPAIIGIALEIAKLAAPKLVGALAGDQAADVADKVITVAQQVTGTATPEAALQKLQADPNLVLQANVRMQEIEADIEKAYLADRQNARDRDRAMIQAGMRNTRADAMVLGCVIGLIACLVTLALYKSAIPGEVVGILSTIAGIFGSCLKDAFSFEFGSSRSSRDKDSIIAQQASRS